MALGGQAPSRWTVWTVSDAQSEAVTHAELDRDRVQRRLDGLAGGQAAGGLDEGLGDRQAGGPVLRQVVGATQFQRRAEAALHRQRRRGAGRAAGDAGQRGRGLGLEEVAVGHARADEGAKRAAGIAEAVLAQHGHRQGLDGAQLARALDGAGADDVMLERQADRHVDADVVGPEVRDAADEGRGLLHVDLGAGQAGGALPPVGAGLAGRGGQGGVRAGREGVRRQAVAAHAGDRASRRADVGQAELRGRGDLLLEPIVEVDDDDTVVAGQLGSQLGVIGRDPALEQRLRLRARSGTGRAAALGCGDAVQHHLEARRERDVGDVHDDHVGRALVQHVGLDGRVELVRQRRHVGAADGGRRRGAAGQCRRDLAGRQQRAQQRRVGRAGIGRGLQVRTDDVGRVVAAAVDDDQVAGRVAAGGRVGRHLRADSQRVRRAAGAGVRDDAAADGVVRAARLGGVGREGGAGEGEEVAERQAVVGRDALDVDRVAARLNGELVAEGAAVLQAVAEDLDRVDGDLGGRVRRGAAAAARYEQAAQQRGRGRCDPGEEGFHRCLLGDSTATVA
ncbi:unnamed protein product [Rotaria sp. Silwood1]|nr:unnamed protein product [Rotaria sp. Silwood1]